MKVILPFQMALSDACVKASLRDVFSVDSTVVWWRTHISRCTAVSVLFLL